MHFRLGSASFKEILLPTAVGIRMTAQNAGRSGYLKAPSIFVVYKGHHHSLMSSSQSPLLHHKAHDEPSVFTPENLLREARRQNDVEDGPVPDVCLLDPDGDIVDRLRDAGRATPHPHWPGYHTTLYETELGGRSVGVLGRAVGAPFAVLVAEQLFAAGCELLLSVTSAGQIVPRGTPPYVVLIDEALRDEGTSDHYRPPAAYAPLNPSLRAPLTGAFSAVSVPVHAGRSWTTDAPYRETESAIAAAREEGILAVEMEAAALYAFAEARSRPVVCFAHVTNQMAVEEGDFEKGEAEGVRDALSVVRASMEACDALLPDPHPDKQKD